MSIEPSLTAYGLLGKTLGYSYSPLIHKTLGNDEYSLYERNPEELADFFSNPALKGLNITIPYKVDALKACTTVSSVAKRIGCVNTMVRREDGWYGHNTDYDGFLFMLKVSGIQIPGKKVIILGDGATAHTIHIALEDLEAKEILHLSRNTAPFYSDAPTIGKDADIVINVTPVGMAPHCPDSLIDLKDFPNLEAAIDVVYNPYRTALLIEAENRGLRYADGLAMLVGQAVAAAKLFLNKEFTTEESLNIVKTIRKSQENIVLIGMPGVGKTTVGSTLSQLLNRPIIDCDAIFEERYGHPSTYIATYGEADFREKETAILHDISKETGAIIATGGGVITRSENYALLRQNSRIYWLRRPLEKLDTSGRVLSNGGLQRLQELYTVREPLYTAFAQVIIDYTTPDNGAQQIANEFHAYYDKPCMIE